MWDLWVEKKKQSYLHNKTNRWEKEKKETYIKKNMNSLSFYMVRYFKQTADKSYVNNMLLCNIWVVIEDFSLLVILCFLI